MCFNVKLCIKLKYILRIFFEFYKDSFIYYYEQVRYREDLIILVVLFILLYFCNINIKIDSLSFMEKFYLIYNKLIRLYNKFNKLCYMYIFMKFNLICNVCGFDREVYFVFLILNLLDVS